MSPDPRGLSFSSHEIAIDPGEVARLAHCDPGRWAKEIHAGIAEGRALIAPRARCLPVDAGALDGLFHGGTPVEEIAARGACWAFAATIGEPLEARVRDHFGSGHYLEAVVLDAVGSVAVEAVCQALERACAPAGPSARFSPGYCLWRLANQEALFALLRPGEIGIRLMASMIMHPLKSVSGLVVQAASGEDLVVAPEDCAPCEATGCTRRAVTSQPGAQEMT
jgi:hypothetical protein